VFGSVRGRLVIVPMSRARSRARYLTLIMVTDCSH
jgi:hypothetical protein